MKTGHVLHVDQQQLVDAWRETLTKLLKDGDHLEVMSDQSNSDAIRIHIDMAGRSQLSFDFKCTYVDDREVKVELMAAQQGTDAIDERDEQIQAYIKEYVRHLHETAQAVQTLTHA